MYVYNTEKNVWVSDAVNSKGQKFRFEKVFSANGMVWSASLDTKSGIPVDYYGHFNSFEDAVQNATYGYGL